MPLLDLFIRIVVWLALLWAGGLLLVVLWILSNEFGKPTPPQEGKP